MIVSFKKLTKKSVKHGVNVLCFSAENKAENFIIKRPENI